MAADLPPVDGDDGLAAHRAEVQQHALSHPAMKWNTARVAREAVTTGRLTRR